MKAALTRYFVLRPRRDSNSRSRLRRAVLYPLSYGGRSIGHGADPVKGRNAMYQRSCCLNLQLLRLNVALVLFSTRAGRLVERARRARGRADDAVDGDWLRSTGCARSSGAAQYATAVECAA